LVELLYIGHQSRWIHHSYAFLVGDYIHRLEERLASTPGKVSLLQSYSELNEPFEVTDRILTAYPEAETQILNAQDVQHFLILCRRPAQKPVNFIPVLDENFEFYFKKDSLAGPAAAKFSTQIDQPIQSILDSIHESHVEYLIRDLYKTNKAAIPYIEYFGGKLVDPEMPQDVEGLTVTYDNYKSTYRLSSSAAATLPKLDSWLSLVAGPNRNWRHALLMADVVAQGQKFQANPIRRIFTPSRGLFVEISYPNDPSRTTIVVREQPRHNQYIDVIEVKLIGENKIQVNMIKETTALGKPAALPLEFTYHPEAGYSPIREVMEGRNDRIKEFYWKAWFGEEPLDLDADVTAKFDGGKTTITGEAINDFVHAVGNHGEAFVDRPGKTVYAPMDFAIVIGWKAITKPIFPRTIDGDLLKLVHLSNQFRMIPGAEPLKKGDEVSTTAQINAVINQEAGKMVEVCGTLVRDGKPVMEVTSQFLYRGTYTDYENTFQRKVETPIQVHLATTRDVAILRSKQWFSIDELPQTLTCSTVFSSIETRGQVLLELPTKEIIQVGSVDYETGESHGNPVVDYLERNGQPIDQPINFENPIPLSGMSPLALRALPPTRTTLACLVTTTSSTSLVYSPAMPTSLAPSPTACTLVHPYEA
ncbi:Fatty acid synthase subunit beta, partial [Fusarium oxysporum f. sp. conglutinans]